MRTLRYGSFAHQQGEIHARDIHHTSDAIAYYGDGVQVMVVLKSKKTRRARVEVREPGDVLWHGGPFVYADHFLPEEMRRGA